MSEKRNVTITNIWLLINTGVRGIWKQGERRLPHDFTCHGWGVLSFVGDFPLENALLWVYFITLTTNSACAFYFETHMPVSI